MVVLYLSTPEGVINITSSCQVSEMIHHWHWPFSKTR